MITVIAITGVTLDVSSSGLRDGSITVTLADGECYGAKVTVMIWPWLIGSDTSHRH